MARFGEMFPSRWLRASDMDGDVVLTIKDVAMEKIGQGADMSDKYVLYFKEDKKGLILNKTNAAILCKLFGDDTDEWIDRRITLFACDVQFKQEMVEAIRIRPRVPKGPAQSAAAKIPAESHSTQGEDDIPF